MSADVSTTKLTNDIKSQIGGQLIQAERLSSLGPLLEVLNEEYRLVQNNLDQTQKMLRLETRENALAKTFPLVALSCMLAICLNLFTT